MSTTWSPPHDNLGRTVVMVPHDLNLAIRYSDHLIVMRDGRIVARGIPGDIINAGLLREVFDLEASVFEDPISGRPMIAPIVTRHVLASHNSHMTNATQLPTSYDTM